MIWTSAEVPCSLQSTFEKLSKELPQIAWLDSAKSQGRSGVRSMLVLETEALIELRAEDASQYTEPQQLWKQLDALSENYLKALPGIPTGVFAWLSYESGFVGLDWPHNPLQGALLGVYGIRAALLERGGRVELMVVADSLEAAKPLIEHWLERCLQHSQERSIIGSCDHSRVRTLEYPNKKRYLQGIREAQQQFKEGSLEQVCLTYPIHLEGSLLGPETYLRLREISPADSCAYFHTPELYVASTSPETLFSIQDEVVSARPMKGTRKRGVLPDQELIEELRNNPKDRAENGMIATMLCEELETVCDPGSAQITEPFQVEVFANVLQMTSTVEGRLRSDVGPFQVYGALAPAGSMTGRPKKEACAFLADFEQEPRALYSGSVAWIDGSGRSVFNVLIRTLQSYAGRLSWHVGGGIVTESDPKAEWMESRAKAATLFALLERADEALR